MGESKGIGCCLKILNAVLTITLLILADRAFGGPDRGFSLGYFVLLLPVVAAELVVLEIARRRYLRS